MLEVVLKTSALNESMFLILIKAVLTFTINIIFHSYTHFSCVNRYCGSFQMPK